MTQAGRSTPMTQNGSRRPERKIADFLGAFSLALGVPALVAPGAFARAIGVRNDAKSRMTLRLVGVQEIGTAAGLFIRERPVEFAAARAAGDPLHLALLGISARKAESRTRLGGAIAGVIGITAVDAAATAGLARVPQTAGPDGAIRVRAAVTVRRSPDEVYAQWRDFRNLPDWMAHLESVEPGAEGTSHWKAKSPTGGTVEWDAEIVEEREGKLIRWQSLPGAGVQNSGTVRFATASREQGTEIRLHLDYSVPGGAVASSAAKLLGEDPEQQVRDDLRRFKQAVETGEVPVSDGSPQGVLAKSQMKQRPAHPVEEPAEVA
jgi:uncharacterized membrane protein